jgi:type IV secretory pathway VirB10-like protein
MTKNTGKSKKWKEIQLMKLKRSAVLFLAVIMLMGVMLTGCPDRDNNTKRDNDANSPTENIQPPPPDDPFAPPIQNPPQRPNTPPRDPNAPPSEQQRNQAPPQPGGGPDDPNWVPPPYEPQNP